MTTFARTTEMHHTIRAAFLILGYAMVIGFTDN